MTFNNIARRLLPSRNPYTVRRLDFSPLLLNSSGKRGNRAVNSDPDARNSLNLSTHYSRVHGVSNLDTLYRRSMRRTTTDIHSSMLRSCRSVLLCSTGVYVSSPADIVSKSGGYRGNNLSRGIIKWPDRRQ